MRTKVLDKTEVGRIIDAIRNSKKTLAFSGFGLQSITEGNKVVELGILEINALASPDMPLAMKEVYVLLAGITKDSYLDWLAVRHIGAYIELDRISWDQTYIAKPMHLLTLNGDEKDEAQRKLLENAYCLAMDKYYDKNFYNPALTRLLLKK